MCEVTIALNILRNFPFFNVLTLEIGFPGCVLKPTEKDKTSTKDVKASRGRGRPGRGKKGRESTGVAPPVEKASETSGAQPDRGRSPVVSTGTVSVDQSYTGTATSSTSQSSGSLCGKNGASHTQPQKVSTLLNSLVDKITQETLLTDRLSEDEKTPMKVLDALKDDEDSPKKSRRKSTPVRRIKRIELEGIDSEEETLIIDTADDSSDVRKDYKLKEAKIVLEKLPVTVNTDLSGATQDTDTQKVLIDTTLANDSQVSNTVPNAGSSMPALRAALEKGLPNISPQALPNIKNRLKSLKAD